MGSCWVQFMMCVHAGRLAPDETIRSATLREINAFARESGGGSATLALIETAGGPASPMPSGTLQVQPCACAACMRLLVVTGSEIVHCVAAASSAPDRQTLCFRQA